MAAGNWFQYAANVRPIMLGSIDFETDTFVVVLLESTYTPNRLGHVTWADISAHQIPAGSGYTQGGAVLADKVVAYNSGTGNTSWTSDETTWYNTSISAKYAVLVRRSSGTLQPTDLLVAYADLNTDSPSAEASIANADYIVGPSPSGYIVMQPSTP